MTLLKLLLVILFSILLCKGIGLAIVLIFVIIKNNSLQKDTMQWEDWFNMMSSKKLTIYFFIWYLITVICTSVLTYYILKVFCFKYALSITLVLFFTRFVITAARYWRREDDFKDKWKQKLIQQSCK